jgi:hypothetical protein
VVSTDKRTVHSAHLRIDALEKTIIGMQKEMEIQFKDLFNRVKRLEAIMIGSSAFIIALLVRLVMVG